MCQKSRTGRVTSGTCARPAARGTLPRMTKIIIALRWTQHYSGGSERQYGGPSRRIAGSAAAILVAVAILPGMTAATAEQSIAPRVPGLAFEVASIKPTTRMQIPAPRILPGGQFEMTATTLRDLIRVAYPTEHGQVEVTGGPDWIASARFDVAAKAPTGEQVTMLMLRNLLRERFKLQAHVEMRQGPIWTLTLGDERRRLGEGLTPSRCGAAPDDSPVQTADEALQRLKAGRGLCAPLRIGAGPTLFGEGSLDDLASILSNYPVVNAPVVNRTGLTGLYDIRFRWRADNNPNPDDGPLLFTALEEQLQLRLRRSTGTVEVLVIDRVQPLIPD